MSNAPGWSPVLRFGLVLLFLVAMAGSQATAQTDYADLVPGQWAVVSSNTIEDLDPCPTRDCSYSAVEGVSAVINDWCGGVFASGFGALGGLVAWGGGHNGYFGSEIYVFDLAAHAWVRVTDPYDDGSASVAASCSDEGIYPDGSACPTHTYNAIEYHPPTNELVLLTGTPDPVMGGAVDGRAHLFNFTTGRWRLGAANAAPHSYDAPGAYDAGRDVFWQLYGYVYHLAAYDPNLDAWTDYGSPGTWNIDGAGRVDPVRDLFVFLDARGTAKLYAIPLAAPRTPLIELHTSGDTEIQSADKMGFDWDPIHEHFVAWDDGADVYVLTPPAGDWRTEDWVWTRVPPADGNSVVPSRNANGTYGRFRYAASINAFLLVSSTAGPVWAYRLATDACASGTDCTRPPACRTAVDATCAGGLCIYPAADEGEACQEDGNACTGDLCQVGLCAHPALTGTVCDDGDACTGPDACDDSGACVPGPDTCTACTAGQIRACYDGPVGTENVGTCRAGAQTCSDGTWGECNGQVFPGAELCADGEDNDCDGLADAADLQDCPSVDSGPGGGEKLTGGCGCGSPGRLPWIGLCQLALVGLLLLCSRRKRR
jgi:hypothetical protein